MNEQEFQKNINVPAPKPEINYDSQEFTNIDHEDFIGRWGGRDYEIKAGETKYFPVFLVEHFCKKLADKLMLRDYPSDIYTNTLKRDPLISQMKGIKRDIPEVPQQKTAGDVVYEQIESDNKKFEELEKIKEEEARKKKEMALGVEKEDKTPEEVRKEEIYQKRLAALAKARLARKNKK